ncbi:tRNA (cytidine(56)-2'-O)-methyltransferase [uncultured archaeon]|nr:tRNA (cytidine(56)-2'-O)-methyltransferase [uncultured archaeon]
MQREIVVLRYGHRHVRDYRVTSHCCLVARAFGANRIEVIGEEDREIAKTVQEMNERWGKGAEVEFFDDWKKRLSFYKQKGFAPVHLTMYGLPVQNVEAELAKIDKLLVIIGSQKVEREVYEKADYNVSITLQPHSEIAALAVFLDRLQKGAELGKKFGGAKIEIEPVSKGKKVRPIGQE